jgi:hypothetical protein
MPDVFYCKDCAFWDKGKCNYPLLQPEIMGNGITPPYYWCGREEGLLTKCLKLAHEQGIDTEEAIKCEGECECDNCPYIFD